MLTGAVSSDLFAKNFRPVLAKIPAQGEDFVGENCVVFRERMVRDNRINNAKSACEQEGSRKRKE